MNELLENLSRNGTTLTLFQSSRRPEKAVLSLRLDTGQIIWTNHAGGADSHVDGLGKEYFQ